MATYPGGVYSPRTKNNKEGVVYDPEADTALFAEDIVNDDNEIVAIETELGTNPKGIFATVKAWLETIPVKATGAEIDTGTDDNKFATAKAINDSDVFNIRKDKQQIMTYFESLDGWNKSGAGIAISLGGLSMQTTSSINTTKFISAAPIGVESPVVWTEDSHWQTSFKLSYLTDQLFYALLGDGPGEDEVNSYGFKVVDGTLYAIHISTVGEVKTEYTTEIEEITLTDFNVYRAEFDSVAQEFRFYVNGVLRATHTENIPTAGAWQLVNISLKNTAASNKLVIIKYFYVSQDQ